MRDVEHIYMNVPRWTGRKIEEGTPWLDAAAELESILSQLDSLLGEFGGIGFCSQMGTLSSVTDGINAMRDARKYLHEEIVRLVDKPLEECFARAVERLAAIDFDSVIQKGANEIGLCNYEDTGSKKIMFCQKINGFKTLMADEYGFRPDLSVKINEKILKSFEIEKLEKSMNVKDRDKENDKDKNLMEQLENIILSLLTTGKDTTNLSEVVSIVKTYCEIKRKVKAAQEKIIKEGVNNLQNNVLSIDNVGYIDSTMLFIIQEEGEPFLIPRINGDGSFTIGYGYDFTEDSDPEMFNKYLKRDEDGKVIVINKMTIEDAEFTIKLAADKKGITQAVDDFINGNGSGNDVKELNINQNQYDALFSYFYANGSNVFEDSKYDEWINYGGEYAERAEARIELRNYLVENNGNYNSLEVEKLFLESKGANIKYDYEERRRREADLFCQ